MQGEKELSVMFRQTHRYCTLYHIAACEITCINLQRIKTDRKGHVAYENMLTHPDTQKLSNIRLCGAASRHLTKQQEHKAIKIKKVKMGQKLRFDFSRMVQPG